MGADGIINYDETVDNLNIKAGMAMTPSRSMATTPACRRRFTAAPGNDHFIINEEPLEVRWPLSEIPTHSSATL